MERKEAIDTVLELARENVISGHSAGENQIPEERVRQLEAIEVITDSECKLRETIDPIHECPNCRETWWDGGFIEVDGAFCAQTVGCTNCDTEWREVYQLISREVETHTSR